MKGFFQTLFDSTEDNMSFRMSITKKDDILTVSLIPKVEKGNSYELPPFEAKGTAADLDKQFADAFAKALETNKELLIQVDSFQEGLKAMAEEKKTTTTKKTESTKTSGSTETKEDAPKAEKPAATKKKKKLPKPIQDQLSAIENYKTANNIPFVTYTLDVVIKSLKAMKDVEEYDVDLEALIAERESYDNVEGAVLDGKEDNVEEGKEGTSKEDAPKENTSAPKEEVVVPKKEDTKIPPVSEETNTDDEDFF